MIRRTLWGATLLAALALGVPASAATINLVVSSGGINASTTRTCATANCTSAVWSLASGELFAATGTISIDTTLNQMTINLVVASSVLDASGSQITPDGGASSLAFTGGTYSATVAITNQGGGNYTIDAGQNVAALGFSLVQAVGAGAGAPLAYTNVRVTNGNCLISGNGTGQCGILFGANGATGSQFRVSGAGFGSYDRFVAHQFNLGVVPEPSTLALLGLGLLGLVARRVARG